MSEYTRIEWAEHTGGPFLGCTCVSAGCGHCYAMELAESRLERIFRTAYKKAGFEDWEARPVWGDKATRVLTKGFWDDAKRINAQHAKAGTRGRWFPSMIDWLDTMPAGIIDQDGNRLDPIAVLADFLKLIHDTPNLDWLLLTKRPENWKERIYQADQSIFSKYKAGEKVPKYIVDWYDGIPPANVWIGTSCENQEMADKRIPELLKIPAKVRFLSLEPLLGPLRIKDALHCDVPIHWVIVGGESGKGARPCSVEWIRDIVRQCKETGTACFVKQLGANPQCPDTFHGTGKPKDCSNLIKDKKGGDPMEWPLDVRVRQFPTLA